ncbi:DUF1307 domain-containing protein [Gemella taiwanensis]|uniref:DUF1307 domain-containing protein n=1 Tax=Gemella morbillorum TaxID=29391 RepID=A0AAP9HCI9_9BACL|nr:DUF1307 domain-containing protein [Gemella morbillorum]EFV35347.1 hypothetical protein HMPREF0432_00925 [Gemella morbillorum M424]QGS08872.1 DUF1307 domain-containing protein [Gemella morbillorum]
MKKILKLITPLLATLFLLTACSSEKTKVYTSTFNNNQENETTITYKGDVVNKIKTVANIKDLGTDTESAFEYIKKTVDEKNKDIKGVTYNIERKGDKVIITLNLDFDKIDFDKDKDRLEFKTSSLDEARKLSYVEENIKKEGATEKK